MHPGDRVTYCDVNLASMRGTLVRVGMTPRGGNCVVRWHHSRIESEELQSNLRPILSDAPLTAAQESVVLAWYRTGRFPARQGHVLSGLMRRGLVESRRGFLVWTEKAEKVAEELVAAHNRHTRE